MLLIIDKSQKNAMEVADIFYYMGIVCGIASPEGAIHEISNRYHAILIISPEKIGAIEELIRSLRAYSLGAPVFALCDEPEKIITDSMNPSSLFDKIFPTFAFSSKIVGDIINYQRENGKNILGNYRLAGIDASIFKKEVSYFEIPISLTKTETMIIRYLISSYPAPKKASDILKFAFRYAKMPEISNIRTHISIINRKFRELNERNLIISEPRIGYTILTPCDKERFAEELKTASEAY